MDIYPEFIKAISKFELVLNAEKPKFKKDHEYVDYALSVLGRTVNHPSFGPMLNDLECRNENLNKSISRAEDARILGNNHFKYGRMYDALIAYTRSISFATEGSSQLPLAYGNRSAVLFNKQYYMECLEDIERALETNYPQEKQDKLLKRQTEAKTLLPTQKKVTYHGKVPTIPNINTNIPSASDCIRINENQQYGRHIVATRNIDPGEVLVVEKPYSHFLSNINDPIYCCECFERCYNLIPCKKCAGALYCSKDCRKKAFVEYHQHECTILNTFGYDDIINFNATKMSIKAIKEYDKDRTDTDEYRSDRYHEISKLSCYKVDESRLERLVQAAGPAKVFYVLKNYTDIFAELDMTKEETSLKTLLFKNVYSYRLNMISVDIGSGSNPKIIGNGVYAVSSLFNHACAENVASSFYGSTVVFKATRKIQKGDQCFVNYGICPLTMGVQQRQAYLKKRYSFTCTCIACEQNWPLPTEPPLGNGDPAVFDLCNIDIEVTSGKNLSEERKRNLLEITNQAVEKVERRLSFVSYVYCSSIYKKLLFDENPIPLF